MNHQIAPLRYHSIRDVVYGSSSVTFSSFSQRAVLSLNLLPRLRSQKEILYEVFVSTCWRIFVFLLANSRCLKNVLHVRSSLISACNDKKERYVKSEYPISRGFALLLLGGENSDYLWQIHEFWSANS